jgi:hypothetical protein
VEAMICSTSTKILLSNPLTTLSYLTMSRWDVMPKEPLAALLCGNKIKSLLPTSLLSRVYLLAKLAGLLLLVLNSVKSATAVLFWATALSQLIAATATCLAQVTLLKPVVAGPPSISMWLKISSQLSLALVDLPLPVFLFQLHQASQCRH